MDGGIHWDWSLCILGDVMREASNQTRHQSSGVACGIVVSMTSRSRWHPGRCVEAYVADKSMGEGILPSTAARNSAGQSPIPLGGTRIPLTLLGIAPPLIITLVAGLNPAFGVGATLLRRLQGRHRQNKARSDAIKIATIIQRHQRALDAANAQAESNNRGTSSNRREDAA